jgi:hypothetical protein
MIDRALWRPLIATVVLAAATIVWQVWTASAGLRKTSGLVAHGKPDSKLDVIVTLDFAPESFHMTLAQDLGQLVKTDGKRMYLRGVHRAQLTQYAQAYWVVKIEPWNASN